MIETYPPCEVIGKKILPLIRSYVARELIEKYKFTQIEVAKKLGITQAAVSQYLHHKRGAKSMKEFKEVIPLIEEYSKKLAEKIVVNNISQREIIMEICKICATIREKYLDKKHDTTQ
ncbi:MAG: helix-turn-helix domain-containing protein [Staphylothermus sp.]|nr:helix-turn-helix domain-containing protein [Staphylothermus sp.]